METSLRVAAIFSEVVILMVAISSLLFAVGITVFDLGLNRKYERFMRLVLTIIGGIALVFVISHLITFYPRIVP